MKYMYGGYIMVGGKLDNGKPWNGFRILLAPLDNSGKVGWKTTVVKASYTDGFNDKLADMELGSVVSAYFDETGRCVELSPVPWTDSKEVN